MKKILLTIVAATLAISLTACGTNKNIEEAKEARSKGDNEKVIELLKNEKSDEAVKMYNEARAAEIAPKICGYIEMLNGDDAVNKIEEAENDGVDDGCLAPYISQAAAGLCQSYAPYYIYEFIDRLKNSLSERLGDSEIPSSLEQVLKDNGDKKVIAYMDGSWKCVDDTAMNGAITDIKYDDDDSCSGVLRDGINGFPQGAVLWSGMTGYDETTVTFKLMTEVDGDSASYEGAKATVDYENATLTTTSTYKGNEITNTWKKQ